MFVKPTEETSEITIDTGIFAELVVKVFEKFGDDADVLRGVAIYCDAMGAICQFYDSKIQWLSFVNVAKVFQGNAQLKIGNLLNLEKVTQDSSVNFYILSVVSVKTITLESRLELFFYKNFDLSQ